MTTTNHPAPESEREAIARMLKEQGFTSRDGTVINGGTYGVIDAILSRRMGAEPVAEPSGIIRCNLCDYEREGACSRPGCPLASPPAPALDARTVEIVAEALQNFWQGASGRTWAQCNEKLPPQADWFRRLAEVALRADRGE